MNQTHVAGDVGGMSAEYTQISLFVSAFCALVQHFLTLSFSNLFHNMSLNNIYMDSGPLDLLCNVVTGFSWVAILY